MYSLLNETHASPGWHSSMVVAPTPWQSLRSLAELDRAPHFEQIRAEAEKCKRNYEWVINDPLVQTYSPTSSDHYFYASFVSFFDILKSGDGRTDGKMCKNNDHRRPGICVGLVDQL